MPILHPITLKHDWRSFSNSTKIKLCDKCGLLEVETVYGIYHFVHIGEALLACMHEGLEASHDSDESLKNASFK